MGKISKNSVEIGSKPQKLRRNVENQARKGKKQQKNISLKLSINLPRGLPWSCLFLKSNEIDFNAI